MSFGKHRTNLLDWIHFENPATGFPQDAELLLLAEDGAREDFLELLQGRVKKVDTEPREGLYHYIVMPRLTKGAMHLFGESLAALLPALENRLYPGGSLVLGLENHDDVERLASGLYEDNVYYSTFNELASMEKDFAARHPSGRLQRFYPLPSLEMPLRFYTDAHMPAAGEEDVRIGALLSAGTFRTLAPGYFCILTPQPKQAYHDRMYRDWLPVYIKYNSSRKPEYAIKTEILKDDEGRLHVLKEGLSPAANGHIESLREKAALLEKQNPAVSVLHEEKTHNDFGSGRSLSAVLYPYVKGQSLAAILGAMIEGGKAPVKALQESMELVLGASEGELCPANLDCLFDNVLMQEGRPVLIDCEWVQEQPVPVRFLQYRMLSYWYEEYRQQLGYPDLGSFLRLFGFAAEDVQAQKEREAALQREIHGDGEDSNAWAYQQSRVTVQNFLAQQKEIAEQKDCIAELSRQVKERDVALHKEREVQRLTNVHVGNLEKVIAVHERDIATLQRERDYYQRHQSIPSRLHQRLQAKLEAHFPTGTKKRQILSYGFRTLRHPIRMCALYLTEDGRNRIQGDFAIGNGYFENGKLHFERAEQPLVSIVIPCYNQIHYTYQCLLSILQHTDFQKTPYEVIIADDVSTDATRELKRYADNLVLARNTENMGFLKNCNQAAAMARGEFIFFLNNDTKVTEGWLESLVSLMRRDEGIGMAGSKLVYPDGRLQEAGGIIWSDASGWNYGRLQDPAEPEFNYVKDVDYISGAAIMIRTALWKEIGGFDERFAPAYCEDSDLAFEVRRHGRRVVYQPQSVVVHFEGISNGTDVNGTGLKRYQVVNQEKFKEKWKEELQKQSVNDGNPNPFRARERGQSKRYVLVIDHYVPTWDKDAGSKTTWQYLQMLVAKGYQVKFLGDNFLHEEPYTSALEQLGIEVLYGQKMQGDIWNWIDRNKDMIQVCYLNRPHIATKYIDYIREHTRWKCIFYGHDLHFLRERREYELTHDPAILQDAEYWRSMELSMMKKADVSYYPSQVEIDGIHAIDPSINAKAITAYVFSEKAAVEKDYQKREGLLFVGGFAHPPNKDGVLWFAKEIFPLIRRVLPEIQFRIVGSHADEEVLALGNEDGIEVLGFVSDERLAELYQESRLVVVPLRYGAGVKGKVVEALHEGSAIVTTSCGAEGIPGVEQVLRIADQPEEFAAEVCRLYPNVGALIELSQGAVRYVEENFSVDGAWSRIREDFDTDL